MVLCQYSVHAQGNEGISWHNRIVVLYVSRFYTDHGVVGATHAVVVGAGVGFHVVVGATLC